MEEKYIDVYGLHGTSKKQAESIEIGGFDPSQDGYYGEGVYFYEDNDKGREYAISWALRRNTDIGVIKANLYCSESVYIDLTLSDLGLKQLILGFSKNYSSDAVKFNRAVKKLLKNFLSAIEAETGIHYSLIKIFVPEGYHHGWDYGYVVKSTKIIKSQKMLEDL